MWYNRRALGSATNKKGGFCSMKRLLVTLLSIVTLILVFSLSVLAQATHTVVRGDSLWKIAVKYQIGLSEIKSANPQIVNYDLIYPGQIINIPSTDSAVLENEKEVVRLVNVERAKNGLPALTYSQRRPS